MIRFCLTINFMIVDFLFNQINVVTSDCLETGRHENNIFRRPISFVFHYI